MEIYWLERDASDVPAGDAWLSGGERSKLAELRIPKRRDDWRLGRWTAKCALSVHWGLPEAPADLAELELRPAASGAPEVFRQNRPVRVALSLSHSTGRGLCAIAEGGASVGCDVELIEQRSPGFLADFFTEDERKLTADTSPGDRHRLVTLLWSAKESALKALGCGLRSDTCWVNAVPESFSGAPGERWNRLSVTHLSGQAFHGWWSESGGLLRTIVAEPAPSRLVALQPAGSETRNKG